MNPALVSKMLESVEQSVIAIGWTVAAAHTSPKYAWPLGAALREVEEARVLLDLCTAISRPAPLSQAVSQNPSCRLAPDGSISPVPTGAPALNTRDRASGRRNGRRAFMGVPALALRTRR